MWPRFGEPGWRERYYKVKFSVDINNPEEWEPFQKKIAKSYLEGLVWVLRYYYQGCCSWEWFYPFYHAPLAEQVVSGSVLIFPPCFFLLVCFGGGLCECSPPYVAVSAAMYLHPVMCVGGCGCGCGCVCGCGCPIRLELGNSFLMVSTGRTRENRSHLLSS